MRSWRCCVNAAHPAGGCPVSSPTRILSSLSRLLHTWSYCSGAPIALLSEPKEHCRRDPMRLKMPTSSCRFDDLGTPIVRVCGRGVISSRCVMGSALTTIVLMLSSGSTAHQPWDEFADWFRSLKVLGIEKPLNPADAFSCSLERDCQATDYEADATGRYWISGEGERIQVPPDKILHRTDNPTGHAVACLRHFNGHPIAKKPRARLCNNRVRNRLSAGGRRIRTAGPCLGRGLF